MTALINNGRLVLRRRPGTLIELEPSAADTFLASGTPLTGITKDNFKLPEFAKFLEPLRKELLKAAQAASEEPHVQAIYITDFIVQL